jgi:hypothetical protein
MRNFSTLAQRKFFEKIFRLGGGYLTLVEEGKREDKSEIFIIFLSIRFFWRIFRVCPFRGPIQARDINCIWKLFSK